MVTILIKQKEQFMASSAKTVIKFMLVKPAENCTEDLLSIGPRLVKYN